MYLDFGRKFYVLYQLANRFCQIGLRIALLQGGQRRLRRRFLPEKAEHRRPGAAHGGVQRPQLQKPVFDVEHLMVFLRQTIPRTRCTAGPPRRPDPPQTVRGSCRRYPGGVFRCPGIRQREQRRRGDAEFRLAQYDPTIRQRQAAPSAVLPGPPPEPCRRKRRRAYHCPPSGRWPAAAPSGISGAYCRRRHRSSAATSALPPPKPA